MSHRGAPGTLQAACEALSKRFPPSSVHSPEPLWVSPSLVLESHAASVLSRQSETVSF